MYNEYNFHMENLILSISKGFEVFGHQINYYGIISAFAYLLGIVIACLLAKKRGFKTDDIISLACYVIPLAVIGARLGFVLFKLENFTNFWDIFKIWEGGLMFYGGLIGGAIAVALYCLIHKKNFLALIDIIAPSMILSQSLGRWGNFFNQEAYGYVVTNPNLQWFPFSVYIDNLQEWHLATFFYESLWNLISFAILFFLITRKTKIFKQNGIIAAGYLILYGTGRIFIEGLRTDSLMLGSIRVSQLISGIFIVLGISMIIHFIFKNKKKKDGFDKIMNVLKKDL